MASRIRDVSRANSSIIFSPIGIPAMRRIKPRILSIPHTREIFFRKGISEEIAIDTVRRNRICRCQRAGRERTIEVRLNWRKATAWAIAIKRNMVIL